MLPWVPLTFFALYKGRVIYNLTTIARIVSLEKDKFWTVSIRAFQQLKLGTHSKKNCFPLYKWQISKIIPILDKPSQKCIVHAFSGDYFPTNYVYFQEQTSEVIPRVITTSVPYQRVITKSCSCQTYNIYLIGQKFGGQNLGWTKIFSRQNFRRTKFSALTRNFGTFVCRIFLSAEFLSQTLLTQFGCFIFVIRIHKKILLACYSWLHYQQISVDCYVVESGY